MPKIWKEKPELEPEYDLYPTVELPTPPNGVFGWIPSTPEEVERHNRLYPLSVLDWEAPDVVEKRLIVPVTEVSNGITTSMIKFYDQGDTGTCVGFSGSWCTTVRNSTLELVKKYNAIELYKQCRKILGEDPNDLDAGATMPSVGKALRDWGHILVLGKTNQPVSKDEGIESYYWGKSAADVRLAISQDKPAHFGIYWYKTFMSPKLINGEYWIGWQTGSWGTVLGGHAIAMIEWSDTKNAGKFKNTWGSDYPEVWMSATAINRVLAAQGELLICVDRVPVPPTPVGKIELVEALEIQPTVPVLGDNIVVSFVVKNSGNAVLVLTNIGIRGLRNSTENWDFGLQPLSLDVEQAVEIAPRCSKPLEVGSYVFRAAYQDTAGWHDLGKPISFNIKQPPLDKATVDIFVTIDNVIYSAKGIVLNK